MNLTSTVKSPADLTEREVLAWKGFMARQEAFRSPFFSPHYTQAVEQVRPGVRVCVIRSGDEPVAFLPFQFSGTAARLLGAANRVGDRVTDYAGVVAAPDFRISSHRLLALCGLNRYQSFHVESSPVDVGLGETKKGWIMDFSGGPEIYWTQVKKRTKNFVTEIGRRERRLVESCGPLAFALHAPNSCDEMEWLVAAKREHYRRAGIRDPLEQPWVVDLLRILTLSRAEECTGVLSVLYAGDRWVASHFGLRNGGLLHGWFVAYDHELSKFGPGLLIISMVINEGWSHGLKKIDAGCGDELYKKHFATYQNTRYEGTWYRGEGSSRVLRRLASMRRHLSRVAPTFHT